VPRQQRTRSGSGYYHVMLRGNEKKNIFMDEDDKQRFIETVNRMKQEKRFYLHAFCLMDNHIHLMISEGEEDIAKVMKRITVSYVLYFNKKYKRVGHLFQDRYKSEVVADDYQVLTLARYIHQNPVKAGMVKKMQSYRWSSYTGYVNEDSPIAKILDTETIFGILSEDKRKAKDLFSLYMKKENTDSFMDLVEKEGMIDEGEALALYKEMLLARGLRLDDAAKVQVPDDLLIEYKKATNLSIRKIAGITKINKDKLSRILRHDR
jgi:putative transposase